MPFNAGDLAGKCSKLCPISLSCEARTSVQAFREEWRLREDVGYLTCPSPRGEEATTIMRSVGPELPASRTADAPFRLRTEPGRPGSAASCRSQLPDRQKPAPVLDAPTPGRL